MPDFSRANCVGTDPEAFFPKNGLDSQLMAAKRVCARCEIIDSCAEWSIRHEGDGFWAGMTALQRKQIRTERGIVLQTPQLPFADRLAS
jgi:WhiB family redox-sensing transcriptional regulator